MELRQFEYFVAVAEHLHFGRAAQALSIGQPAISQQVARLEREIGVVLVDRTSRTVRLTSAGERFLPEARAVLVAVEQARFAATERPAGAKTLRIGSSSGLGDRLGQVLQALRELLPTTSAEIASAPTRARLERVAAGQLDAAFVRGVSSARGIELIEVWRDRLLAVIPADHELAQRRVIALPELADVPLRIVARRANPPLVDLVLGACDEAGFTPALADHPEPLENVLAAIAGGPPTWSVIYEPHARTLQPSGVAFVPTEPPLVMATSLAVSQNATSRAVAPLLRACSMAASNDQLS